MYIYVVVILLLLLVIGGTLRVGARMPKAHRIPESELERYLNQLLRRGYNGGLAIVRPKQGEQFVRLTKYIRPGRQSGIEFCVPCEWLSSEAKKQLADIAHDEESAWQRADERPGRKWIDYPVHWWNGHWAWRMNSRQMLCFDCSTDLARAKRLIVDTFETVFRLPKPDSYIVEFWGISLHDELIDTVES